MEHEELVDNIIKVTNGLRALHSVVFLSEFNSNWGIKLTAVNVYRHLDSVHNLLKDICDELPEEGELVTYVLYPLRRDFWDILVYVNAESPFYDGLWDAKVGGFFNLALNVYLPDLYYAVG